MIKGVCHQFPAQDTILIFPFFAFYAFLLFNMHKMKAFHFLSETIIRSHLLRDGLIFHQYWGRWATLRDPREVMKYLEKTNEKLSSHLSLYGCLWVSVSLDISILRVHREALFLCIVPVDMEPSFFCCKETVWILFILIGQPWWGR